MKIRAGSIAKKHCAGTPGFRAGAFHEKSSQPRATNGTLHFENCRAPGGNLLVGEGLMLRLRPEFMPGSKAEATATALGVGRAAYEYAMQYARERVQGGRPIVQLQAVAMMLARMVMKIDAARGGRTGGPGGGSIRFLARD